MSITTTWPSVWRYRFRGTPPDGNRCNVTLLQEAPSHGELTVTGSWGCYAYAWYGTGMDDFRDFILSLRSDVDYLFRKLGGSNIFDPERTERAIKLRILADRRSRIISAEDAREEWELCERFEDAEDWSLWAASGHVCIESPYELYCTRPDPQIWQLCEWLLPRLAETIELQRSSE